MQLEIEFLERGEAVSCCCPHYTTHVHVLKLMSRRIRRQPELFLCSSMAQVEEMVWLVLIESIREN